MIFPSQNTFMVAVNYTEYSSYQFHKDFKEQLQDIRELAINFGAVNTGSASCTGI